MVKIDKGEELSFVDSYGSVEKDQWQELFTLKSAYIRNQVDVSVKAVLEAVGESEEVYETLGYTSPTQMITEGYDLDVREIEHARKWMEISGKGDANYKEVVDKAVADAADKRGGDHGNQHTGGKPCNTRIAKDNDNSATAMIRRLAREGHDELIEQIKTGELSPNAAAIEAGFRKKQISVPVGDVAAVVRRLKKHYTLEQLVEEWG